MNDKPNTELVQETDAGLPESLKRIAKEAPEVGGKTED